MYIYRTIQDKSIGFNYIFQLYLLHLRLKLHAAVYANVGNLEYYRTFFVNDKGVL